MRERFERLMGFDEEIENLGLFFDENQYKYKGVMLSDAFGRMCFINGAWFIYQQKHTNFEEFMLSKGFKRSDLEVNNLTGEYKGDRAYWAFVAWGGK